MLASVDLTGWLVSLLPTLGLALVVALFFADGMVLGKFLPPAAVYLAYVALVRPTGLALLAVLLACVAAATLGQWALYRTLHPDTPALVDVRRRWPWLAGLPDAIRRRSGERVTVLLARYFDRFGGPAIVVVNASPVVRSLLTIPAGVRSYPRGRFLLFSTLGNLVYLAVLTLAGRWIVELVRTLA